VSVGFEGSVRLRLFFGKALNEVFGHVAYHVGSSARSKKWRDVDVVIMLDDDEFTAMFGGSIGAKGFKVDKWESTCLAFTLLGKELTRLPIDFKIQPMTWANKHFGGHKEHPRDAIIGFWNYAKEDK